MDKHSRAMCRSLTAILPGFVLLSFYPSVLRVGVSACRLPLSCPSLGNGPRPENAIDEG